MRTAFVETENYLRFCGALSALERRGAAEACLLVVDGRPGLGKTTILHRWAVQTGAVFVRAKREWSPNWFLQDLLDQVRITPKHGFSLRYAQALEAMLLRQASMALQRQTFALVIDEADHISRNARIMETLRDFSDSGSIPIVLVGMGRIRDNLTALPQIASRIAQYVRFEQASVGDVRKFLSTLCEVPVADDLADFVARVTDGYNREVMEAIATIERVGRRNGAGPERPVRLADMAGQAIINDRRSGQPILVPEVVR